MNPVAKLMSFIDKSKIVEARQALREIRIESFKSDRQLYFFNTNELEAKLDRIYFYIWESSLDEARQESRKEAILLMRQIGIYCLYTTLKFTDQQVSDIFRRDRTTVLHSVKVMRNRIAFDENARKKTHHFRRLLNEVLGQMEIESMKKQEYPEKPSVSPMEQPHFTN